ncbi:MAG: hypothetical protein IKY33_00485 [Clostridia bacterium]|nr:hypothetical protein [Clostridia bacterium]
MLTFSAWCFFGPKAEYSDSERRVLAKFPELSWEQISSGAFANDFEEYATDRFPMRDAWRSLKAYARLGIFMQADNNDIFVSDGHISKLEYPIKYEMLDHAAEVLSSVAKRYAEGEVYFAMIPDKNKVLAKLSIDYEAVEAYMAQKMDLAEVIHIGDMLSAEDYYYTDTHWRQEKIVDVAERLGEAMGTDVRTEYEQKTLDTPFYGVYAGQSALRTKPEQIRYLTNDTIRSLTVEGAEVYDMNKAQGKDPYEMFLSGNQPIIRMVNPNCPDGERLILIRDSFGSSIAPLLIEGFSEITLVDLRYIRSNMLTQYVDFEGAKVLFLYSTLLLNNSLALK